LRRFSKPAFELQRASRRWQGGADHRDLPENEAAEIKGNQYFNKTVRLIYREI
jgi:hypothetical protein